MEFRLAKIEDIIREKYAKIQIDASLPACDLSYKRGYQTVDHGSWECDNQVYEIMEKKLHQKNTIHLRPYKESDGDIIASWIKDESALRRWSSDRYESFPIVGADINKKYLDNNGDCQESDNFYPWTAFDEDGVVGHLIMRFTDSEKKTIRFGFVIVDDAKRGMGYGKQMLMLAQKFAFEIYGANKVTLGVFENNPSALYCYKAVGFKETSREIWQIDGKDWTCIEMEIAK